ncbi:MAG: hypothetical protein IH888_13360 [Planctomycetes bacterium]|nr:hypothetical protein [Planctomycetota bacterium]
MRSEDWALSELRERILKLILHVVRDDVLQPVDHSRLPMALDPMADVGVNETAEALVSIEHRACEIVTDVTQRREIEGGITHPDPFEVEHANALAWH